MNTENQRTRAAVRNPPRSKNMPAITAKRLRLEEYDWRFTMQETNTPTPINPTTPNTQPTRLRTARYVSGSILFLTPWFFVTGAAPRTDYKLTAIGGTLAA